MAVGSNVNLIPKDLTQVDDLPVSGSKSGEGHDNCRCCGKESDAFYANSQGRGAQENTEFFLYNCDPKAGGCGSSWDRTTSQGAERNERRGQRTKRLTQGAQRMIMTPGISRAYARGYDAIKNHGEPVGAFANPYSNPN